MPKYTKFLTLAEYKKLTVDEKFAYLNDMAEMLKTHRDYTQRPAFPPRPRPAKPKRD